MKNKKTIIILAILIVLITGIFLVNNIYQNKAEVSKTKRKKQNNLAIMIKEDGATDYTKSTSKDIPKGDYTLNYEKSYCKNNGVIGDYDSTLGKVSFSFVGTDSCFLYFDYKENTELYKIIQKRYNEDKTFIGLYTGEDSENYKNKVYYYKDNVQNNNVLFAGYCWKIVRTTETGGVKLIYNGVQKDVSNDYTLLNQNEYMNLENSSTYPFSFDETSKAWSVGITAGNSSVISFSPPNNGDYVLNYDLSLAIAGNFINVEIFLDGVSQGIFTGIQIGQLIFKNLTTSSVIKVVHTKMYGYNAGRNNVIFSFGKVNSILKSCDITETASQIGRSKYNSSSNSPAYVGYMYNSVYSSSSKTIINSTSFSGTKAYGDGLTYASSKYTLTNATTLSVSSSNISTLVGKYTCNSSSTTGTCTNAWYIVGYSGTTIYYYSLSGGTTDGTTLANKNYVFGSSFTYANGTYTLSSTTTLNSDTFITNKSNVNTHHYTCFSSSSTCSSPNYVYYINIGYVHYIALTGGKSVDDALNEMLYNANTKDSNSSTIKTYIDNWYKNNMTSYTEKLEDTVFCNDRSISNKETSGWFPNGGSTNTSLQFKYYNIPSTPSLKCTNTNDKFTVDSSNGNGALTYPVGLLTVPEAKLANYGTENYLYNYEDVWLLSPIDYEPNSYISILGYSGNLSSNIVNSVYGVRPVISLKPGISIKSGDGSYTSPFTL